MADPRPIIRLTVESQKALVQHAKNLLQGRRKKEELYAKMEAIDVAYARHKTQEASCSSENGVDPLPGSTPCCNVFSKDDVVAPIVVSQVDAQVAYLSEVFLSGTPLFPVVSPPQKRQKAEQLEVLIDDHAQLGGYTRQLLLFIKDAVKYNLGAIEANWEAIEQFSVLADFTAAKGQTIERAMKYFTAIRRLDMYNTFWDETVAPADVALLGDYAGYIEIVSKTNLKRHVAKLASERILYNEKKCFDTRLSATVPQAQNYRVHPVISERVSSAMPGSQFFDWASWIGAGENKNRLNLADGSLYEKVVMYVRIAPDDFGISAPAARTPQIWRLELINNEVLLSAKRIISAYDALPILFGQPAEDGLGLQTKSLAEGAIPFQEAATTLFNIRFQAARRAVSDRALYDPTMIDPDDANSVTAAPKIPVRRRTLTDRGLGDAYMPIPFDMRGTETAINDATVIVGFAQQLSGINGPQQGLFQRGNKSVAEWSDTIGNSDNRLRLPAMLLESQVFFLLKQILALNIFQYGDNAQIVSQKTGETITVDIAELRKEVMAFKMADGYTPKAKLASVEALTLGMNMLMNSPILQQSYGESLPDMFAHMMQLTGVNGLEQYSPSYRQQHAQGEQTALAAAMAAATFDQNGMPISPDEVDPMAQNAAVEPLAMPT